MFSACSRPRDLCESRYLIMSSAFLCWLPAVMNWCASKEHIDCKTHFATPWFGQQLAKPAKWYSFSIGGQWWLMLSNRLYSSFPGSSLQKPESTASHSLTAPASSVPSAHGQLHVWSKSSGMPQYYRQSCVLTCHLYQLPTLSIWFCCWLSGVDLVDISVVRIPAIGIGGDLVTTNICCLFFRRQESRPNVCH